MKQNTNCFTWNTNKQDNEKEDFQERGPIPFFSVCLCVHWLLTLPLRNPAKLLNVQTDRHQRPHHNRNNRHNTHQSQHTS